MRKGIPQQDISQDITNASVNRSDNITTMTFTRKLDTGDTEHDIILHCLSILFAWGNKTILRNSIIEVHNPTFEEVFENETCFCSAIGVTPMPSSTFTPAMPAALSTPLVNTDSECPLNCSVALSLCKNSTLCRTLWERYQMACHQIKSDGVGNSSLHLDECKLAVENLKSDQHGMSYMCCICDGEMCMQKRRNFEESYGVSTVESNMCNMMHNSCKKNREDGNHFKLILYAYISILITMHAVFIQISVLKVAIQFLMNVR